MQSASAAAAPSSTAAFFASIRRPLAFRLFLLRRLPAAYFSGLRIVVATEERCTVSVPFTWATQNPFRSTYFACLSMAAEMSTGVLAMAQVQGSPHPASMLVTGCEAQFYKKAKSRTYFTCTEGAAIKKAVQAAVDSGLPQTLKVTAEGRNEGGERIASFVFEWSFKRKDMG